MKRYYLLLAVLAVSTIARAQLLKSEADAKTGQEIRSAVTVLGNGLGQQLNFFSRGDEKLIEFAEARILERWPAKILKTMSINIKLKNDSLYRFPVDTSKYTVIEDHGFLRSSIVAVVRDDQLTPLLNSQVRSLSLGFGDQKDVPIPAISDNNRREIKRAVAYILGNKSKP